MGKWDLFRRYWNLSDDDPVITDASTANDSLIEDLILRFQGVSKEITDKLALFSAARSTSSDDLRSLQDSVILAYSAALNGDLDKVKEILGKVVSV